MACTCSDDNDSNEGIRLLLCVYSQKCLKFSIDPFLASDYHSSFTKFCKDTSTFGIISLKRNKVGAKLFSWAIHGLCVVIYAKLFFLFCNNN